MDTTRRALLTAVAPGALWIGCGGASRPRSPGGPSADPKPAQVDEVTPSEDLMREHGVLRRVMFLYDEASQRLDARRDVPIEALLGGARMIRRVIEDYHEKLEEQLIFPRFEAAGRLGELTATLRRQHASGRAITEQILTLGKALGSDSDRQALALLLRSFNHMYRPHAAREDTVLFPELRALVGAKAYDELGDQMEAKETEILGNGGFEQAVADVAKLEQAFGVDHLAKLTA